MDRVRTTSLTAPNKNFIVFANYYHAYCILYYSMGTAMIRVHWNSNIAFVAIRGNCVVESWVRDLLKIKSKKRMRCSWSTEQNVDELHRFWLCQRSTGERKRENRYSETGVCMLERIYEYSEINRRIIIFKFECSNSWIGREPTHSRHDDYAAISVRREFKIRKTVDHSRFAWNIFFE